MSKRRFKGGGRRFIRLWLNVKRSEAYHGLNAYGRAALIEFLDKYSGVNNGMIVMGVREMADRLQCAQGSAIKAIGDLDDAGLVQPMELGQFKGRKATTYRITFLRCDATGELPVNNWPERSRGEAQIPRSVHVVKRNAVERSRGEAQKPKSSMNDPGERSRGDAHIDIYHTPTDQDQHTQIGNPSSVGPNRPADGEAVPDPKIVALGKPNKHQRKVNP